MRCLKIRQEKRRNKSGRRLLHVADDLGGLDARAPEGGPEGGQERKSGRRGQGQQEMLRQKLMTRGYDSDTITQVIGQMDFGLDESAELDALRKCAAKAKKRYEKKYKSTQLRNTVFRYCAAQGFDTEDIYVILDEMKWSD